MTQRRSPYDVHPVDIPESQPPRLDVIGDALKDAEKKGRQDPADDVSKSTVEVNSETAELARAQKIAPGQQLKPEEEERNKNRPAGIRQRPKEEARSIHLKTKIIAFFWSRPATLIQNWFKSGSNYVNYKNYISLAVWITWIIIPILYGLYLIPSILLGSIFLMGIFYFFQFEIMYFLDR
jgi:hypothetical protein